MKKYIKNSIISICIFIFIVGTAIRCQGLLTQIFRCPLSKQDGNTKLYSQGFEDYILSIVFASTLNGVYVDVGANNPDVETVTKYFYLKGWKGIHIEPLKKWYDELVQKRPDSINLNIGLSNKEGELEFFHFTNRDTWSTFNKNAVITHNNQPYESYKIPVKTLTQVLEQYPFNKAINFIKIDVEGLEKEVLKGMDFKKFRPQVFVIEATEPGTEIPSHQPWEQILLDNNYNFAMFDGINRYYLAKEYNNELASGFYEAMRCTKVVNNYYIFWKYSKLLFNKNL